MNNQQNAQADETDVRRPLDSIFSPRTVAVIGATETEGAVGRTVFSNVIHGSFGGTAFPINPKRKTILGVPCFSSIRAVPKHVDLAVVVTPAEAVPQVIGECADAKVSGAIIISAGFREVGNRGADLEQAILRESRRGRMRVIGPNCLGVMSPLSGLNATFAKGMAKPGSVAFLSQSGALCTAILDWSLREQVGFSAFVSTGSMLDVGWGDLIDYFGDDPSTKSILLYMESIGDPRSFLAAAREVALSKPIIVIKAGRTADASRAAVSHTGALTGSDEVLDAAFRRAGILRVDRISDLFYMADVLAKQPRPRGPRLTIVTNAGGPGVLATDALVTNGCQLAHLSSDTITSLNAILPAHWSKNNPIDILGDAGPKRYADALDIAIADPNSDGLLVVLTPQDMTDPTATAREIQSRAHGLNKPVLASWMGGEDVEQGREILNQSVIPTFEYPDSAARAFAYMWQYSANLRTLYETPALPDDFKSSDAHAKVAAIIRAAQTERRTILTETESKDLLAAYDIPTVPTRPAATPEQAVKAATDIGYPVVLKVLSKTITHKSDVGGVQLNLATAPEVERAFESIRASVTAKAGEGTFLGVAVQPMLRLDGYELILGSSIDSQFGPVLLFGLGGQLVEVLADRALALPPLNTTLARRLMERTRIHKALPGVRGRLPVDISALERLLVRFSQLVVEQRWIKEIDINPLLASPSRLVALDARVVLHDPATPEDQLPRPAIRPYPIQYVMPSSLPDGTPITIRPIRPEDEPLMVRFHRSLSDESVRYRYFHAFKLDERIAHERLIRVCMSDYDRQVVLVIEISDPMTQAREVIGVGRLSKVHGTTSAECALVVSDRWHRRGLGTRLLQMLLKVAFAEKLTQVTAEILPANIPTQRIFERCGFHLRRIPDDDSVHAEMALDGIPQLQSESIPSLKP